ncbi:MAG: G8 domain-containing protein [Candidatus Binataceae bacterium]
MQVTAPSGVNAANRNLFSADAASARFADAPLSETVDEACKNTKPSTNLKACVDDGTKNVTIGEGAKDGCKGTVVVEKDSAQLTLGNVVINTGGTLQISDEVASTTKVILVTTGIDVKGGSMLIGSAACPIGTIKPTDNVTLRFVGNKPTTCGAFNQPTNTCAGWVKGIQVEPATAGGALGGTLRMYGNRGVVPNGGVSWTTLSQPAGDPLKFSKANGVFAPPPKDSNIIYTSVRVDTGKGAWLPNDWIAVATTSFSPWETEFVQIKSLGQDTDNPNATGSKIVLNQGLAFYHFGGPDPGDPSTAANYMAGAATNYGVDERAEVGLITRNIILTSDSDEPGNTVHWGGEMKFLKGFQAISIQGVEVQKFGKEQLGSYPFHFHMDGDLSGYTPANLLIDSNSVDHSYNKCITVHSTQNVSYSNNVCARITGHIFYEEVGDETNVTFMNNVGMGAMSNSFDVNSVGTNDATQGRVKLISLYYWIGDNMFAPPTLTSSPSTFDQINIFDTGNQNNPQGGTPTSPIKFITTRGNCGFFNNQGKFINTGPPGDANPITCYPGNPSADKVVYFEPPSGFWILNPSAKLIGNAIAGCQDTGAAYWYVPPPDGNLNAVRHIPIGPNYPQPGPAYPSGIFQNNRGSACYRGITDDKFEVSTADQLFGYQNAMKSPQNHPLVGEFDSPIITRIRDRGIWLRPVFFVVKNARLAMVQHGISFVTSGGADGNYPGVWSLLSHSTMVGISDNNVDRFGPCGSKVLSSTTGAQIRGGAFGCIDQTVPISGVALGGEFTEHGFSTPDVNLFGFMSYDGPPLIIQDRFVNYLVDPTPLLDTTDKAVLSSWKFPTNLPNTTPYTHYEGDAGIGWLESNQSAYPTAATTSQLTFTNVDFRHQVFTNLVNLAEFNDGDKNTAIIDLDGTLSGYGAGNASGAAAGAFPISLNNLQFNASANSVDECRAQGQQNTDLEGRPTAEMAPSSIGQLEFESQYPTNPGPPPAGPWPANDHTQGLTFYKDDLDFGQHGSMLLHSRNGLGVWEPKVTSGYGYVVRADPFTIGNMTSLAGIPPLVDISLVDTVKPNITPTTPFYVQLGICYTNGSGGHPASSNLFTVTHGYRSWAGGGVEPSDLLLRKYFNQLTTLSTSKQWCNNLDYQGGNNLGMNGFLGCPTDGVALMNGSCPTGTSMITDQQGKTSCLYPQNTPPLTASTTGIAGMTVDGTPNGAPNISTYFYDPTTGMLYLWVAQTDANAVGPSPLGNCTGGSTDPTFCPEVGPPVGISTGESYYNCPAEGCPTYRVVLNDPAYTNPTTSTCPVFGSTGDATGWLTGTGGATWPGAPKTDQFAMVLAGTTSLVVRTTPVPTPLPHYAAASAPTCAINQIAPTPTPVP